MSKKSKKEWYLSWWFITLIIIGFILIISLLINEHSDNVKIGLINIDTEDTDEGSYLLTQDDCPISHSDCNGTTRVVYNYKIENNECIEVPLIEKNSFSCGYKVLCDPIECNNRSTTICDGTTKNITNYKCDDRVGCYAEVALAKNSTDCGYIERYSGKYTLQDVNKIRILAKKCKFDVTKCIDFEDYKFSKIYMGKSKIAIVDPNTLEETYQRIYLDGYVRTPYIETLIFAANKEKLYENYTDEDIINYLNLNKFWIIINPKDNSNNQYIFGYYSSLNEPIGNLQEVIVKYNGELYKSTMVESKTYSREVTNFNDLFDKNVELIIVGDDREVKTTIDMNKYW